MTIDAGLSPGRTDPPQVAAVVPDDSLSEATRALLARLRVLDRPMTHGELMALRSLVDQAMAFLYPAGYG